VEGGRPAPPPHTPSIKKFSNRARLFFGNLPRDFSEEELRQMLVAHGEVQEIYHSKEKNFAFARMLCYC
jgi:non-POU domain-containing octamer-binding protein/proline- and glutamine-rich splicing factor